MTPPVEPTSPMDGGIRKRVCKACDRCRLKKSKCDGSSPCSRCKADNAICVFGERKKSHDKVYPKGYVEMLENQQAQLVTGLQELYRRLQNGQGWSGSPLKESTRGMPLTHDILERLGALKQEGQTSESFEENLDILQQRLIAGGAGFMQRTQSFDTSSDIDHASAFEQSMATKMSAYQNAFPHHQFPPTPPNGSPFSQMSRSGSPTKTPTPGLMMQHQQPMGWTPEVADFAEAMDFNMAYESPLNDPTMDMMAYPSQTFPDHPGMAINPCLTMKDWRGQDEQLRQYFQPGVFS